MQTIAVVTASAQMFKEFTKFIYNDEGDIKYVRVASLEDCRGRFFSGYTCLVDWYKIPDDIIEIVKSRIRI